MDGPQEFFTEEYFRYSEECRRLARLSGNPQQAIRRRRAAPGERVAGWLRELRGQWAPAPLAVRFARLR